jgi:predicted patatin/cPLA2 family phospholipase
MLAAVVPASAFGPSPSLSKINVVLGMQSEAVCARQRPAITSLRSVVVMPPSTHESFKQEESKSGKKPGSKTVPKTRVSTADEFRKVVAAGAPLGTLEVVGDASIQDMQTPHPVLQVLAQRRAEGSKPLERKDKFKVALALEGGGMRGCVAAGMASALLDAGLGDCFDEVYGSSAGSLCGAYWIAPPFGMIQYGTSLYYDLLTGKHSQKFFIDKTRALELLGYGFARYFTPRFLKEILGLREKGLPLLNLDYLLRTCVEDMRPLDWVGFAEREKKIPLYIVASDVNSMKAIALNRKDGHFSNIREMTKCMSASMNLPAIAGPLVELDSVPGGVLADAQLFEPVPFKSALENGCTHVLVMRTRPDGINCVPKPSKIEAKMMRNFFEDRPEIADYLIEMKHKQVYCEDVLRLNEASKSPPAEGPQLLAIAPPVGCEEIGRLERGRDVIFEGVKEGYRSSVKVLMSQPGLWPEADMASTPQQATDRAFPADLLDEPPAFSRSTWIDSYLHRKDELQVKQDELLERIKPTEY